MRPANWPRLLNEYIVQAQARYREIGFKPGEFDCCTFAAGWVRLMTGVDHLAEYRGKYSTETEGRALIESVDGSLLEALTKRLGEPVHPSMAQRGDIALRVNDGACGIYFTSGVRMLAVFLGEGGFVLHRIKDTDHAFRV